MCTSPGVVNLLTLWWLWDSRMPTYAPVLRIQYILTLHIQIWVLDAHMCTSPWWSLPCTYVELECSEVVKGPHMEFQDAHTCTSPWSPLPCPYVEWEWLEPITGTPMGIQDAHMCTSPWGSWYSHPAYGYGSPGRLHMHQPMMACPMSICRVGMVGTNDRSTHGRPGRPHVHQPLGSFIFTHCIWIWESWTPTCAPAHDVNM